jgi:hypothetical protein
MAFICFSKNSSLKESFYLLYKVLMLFYDRSGNLPLQNNLDFKSKLRNANNVVVLNGGSCIGAHEHT